MDNTNAQYRNFYRALIRFEIECPRKLKPNCPAALVNVCYIHQILEPDDQDFAQNRIDRVIQKIKLVISLTQRVLCHIDQYVKPGEHWWVRAKTRTLRVYSAVVEMSMMPLCFEVGQTQEMDQNSGIGGLNIVEIESQRIIDSGVLRAVSQLIDVLQ